MPKIDLFFDSSALFSGIVSASGASRALLLLAEAGQTGISVSEQVIIETERAIVKKAPKALPFFRQTIISANVLILRLPTPAEIEANRHLIRHPADVPILVAAMKARTDYLVTLNSTHFLDDPEVAKRSGLKIGLPESALFRVRELLNLSSGRTETGQP